jgi:hypothetical protein
MRVINTSKWNVEKVWGARYLSKNMVIHIEIPTRYHSVSKFISYLYAEHVSATYRPSSGA